MMDEKENLNNDDNLEASSIFGAQDIDEQKESMFEEPKEIEENQEILNPKEDDTSSSLQSESPSKSLFDEATPEEPIAQSTTLSEAEPVEQKKPAELPIEPIEDVQDTEDDEDKPTDIVTVRPVKFKKFEPTEPVRSIKKNLDIMQDISMHISVELGRTKSSIKEVMDLEEGSVVELDKIAGEQVEIYVNGKIVARGEVIVIEDKFGVRVTSTNLPKNPNP